VLFAVASLPAAAPGAGTDAPFLVSLGNVGVDRLTLSGQRARLLGADAYDAAWSADGTRLTYVQGLSLYLADGDGSNPRIIATGSMIPSQPSLSPDGTRVVFVSTGFHLYVEDLAAETVTQITGSSQRDEHPQWSPRGDRIVFTRRDATSRPELWIVGPTGGDRQITFGGVNTYSDAVSWSPDGAHLAFVETNYEGNRIALADPDGTHVARITGVFPQGFWFVPTAWSPDGSQIAFMQGQRTLSVVGADGQGLRTVVGDVGADATGLSWRGDAANLRVELTDLDQLVPRAPITVTGSLHSTGSTAAAGVVLTPTVAGGRVVRATLGGAVCASTCTTASVAPDSVVPFVVTVTPTRPGALSVGIAVTAANDAVAVDNSASTETTVSSCTMLGTDGNDRLHVHGPSTVCALAGDDIVYARNGKPDTIDGGPGSDTAIIDRVDRVRHVEHVEWPRR
jgi:dipeptidyl aminopeptidase/acylaminoacyl peptidase